MKFALRWASTESRQETVDLETLEQLIEFIRTEGGPKVDCWGQKVITREVIIKIGIEEDIAEITIYDDYVE